MANRSLATGIIIFVIGFLCPLARAQVGVVPSVNAPAYIFDDATIQDPGTASFDIYTSYSRSTNGYYISAPGLDFAVGLTPHLEFSATSGLARSKDDQDVSYGRDDNYFGLKILLRSKGDHRPAIAIKPTLELVNNAADDSSLTFHRTNWVMPLLIRQDFDVWAVSYTGGYITRGVAFSTVKLEGNWWDHLTPSLTISYSQFTSQLGTLSQLGLNRRQTDVLAGIDRDINQHMSIFVDVGRTIGRIDPASASFECTVGLSFTTSLWHPNAGTKRRRFPIHF